MGRPSFKQLALKARLEQEFKSMQLLRQGNGLSDPTRMRALTPRLRRALDLADENSDIAYEHARVRLFAVVLRQEINSLLASATFGVLVGDLTEDELAAFTSLSGAVNWTERCRLLAQDGGLGWTDEGTIRHRSDEMLWELTQALVDQDEKGNDPHTLFVTGVLAYAQVLSDEERDPALVRLRNNTSLTLHVLGFHAQRVKLGQLTLPSARLVDDASTTVSILLDDLGWANYLLGDADTAIENIEAAIDFGSGTEIEEVEAVRQLVAKAHRHLGVILSQAEPEKSALSFARSEEILSGLADSLQVRVERAHICYARALAITISHGVNVDGTATSSNAHYDLGRALVLTREAKSAFFHAAEQGRFAKALVLELRILEGLGRVAEAKSLVAAKERAIAASVWSRPRGRTSITRA